LGATVRGQITGKNLSLYDAADPGQAGFLHLRPMAMPGGGAQPHLPVSSPQSFRPATEKVALKSCSAGRFYGGEGPFFGRTTLCHNHGVETQMFAWSFEVRTSS
jgi:hypothetical protein